MLASILAAPWAVSKLPEDCLINGIPSKPISGGINLVLSTIRNVLGAFLILLGIVMVVTPGPGLIVILLGLAMASFPGKQILVRKIGSQKSVFQMLNWMRARHQQPPFLHPD